MGFCSCHWFYHYHWSCFVYLLLPIALLAVCRPIICFLFNHVFSRYPCSKIFEGNLVFFPRICPSPFMECLQTHYVLCVTIYFKHRWVFLQFMREFLHVCSGSVGWENLLWTGFFCVMRWTTVWTTLMWRMFVWLDIPLWLLCIDTCSRMGAYGFKLWYGQVSYIGVCSLWITCGTIEFHELLKLCIRSSHVLYSDWWKRYLTLWL